jgi:hypothetical protein
MNKTSFPIEETKKHVGFGEMVGLLESLAILKPGNNRPINRDLMEIHC